MNITKYIKKNKNIKIQNDFIEMAKNFLKKGDYNFYQNDDSNSIESIKKIEQTLKQIFNNKNS